MLGTPQERVKLLKAGADGKLIEKLYVERNNFKVVTGHVLLNLTDNIDIKKNERVENQE